MLQQRGQVTAAQVAEELEVSTRTARRDLEALGVAGLPVYSTPGRNGGWRLLGDGRTDLSGLSTGEAISLFSVVGAVLDATSGLDRESRAARRKLLEALPEPVRASAERAAERIRYDPNRWSGPAPGPAAPTVEDRLVQQVRTSLIDERRVDITYRSREGRPSTRSIDPLGLVHRQGHWYLLAGTDDGRRTFRLDRIEQYDVTDLPSHRPPDFDLDTAWGEVDNAVDALRWSVRAEVEIDQGRLGRMYFAFGPRLEIGDTTDHGTVMATVRGWSVEELAALLAGFHPEIEVLGPAEVRTALAAIGRTLIERYPEDVTPDE